MHPAQTRSLNQQRISDLQRARRTLADKPARTRRPPLAPARQATGWFLVRVGLRLAIG